MNSETAAKKRTVMGRRHINCEVEKDVYIEIKRAAIADGGRSVSSWVRALIQRELERVGRTALRGPCQSQEE